VVSLAVHIENYGPWEAPAGTPLSVYTQREEGGWLLERTLSLTEELPAFTGTGAFLIELPVERALSGVRVIAGDGGDGVIPDDDCVPEDNTLDWFSDLCAE